MHTQTHRQAHPHSGTNTLRPGSLWYHIMRAPARPSHEASAEMIQGSPLGPHSISQVELPIRTDSRTATLHYSPELVIISLWLHEEYNLELQDKCKTQKSFIKDVFVFFP